QSGGCSSIAARISRFRGVDPAQPFYNAPLPSANFDEQNSGDIDTGTEAAAGANDMLVVASFVADDRTVSAGGGWSQSFDQGFNVSRDAAIALHYRLGG